MDTSDKDVCFEIGIILKISIQNYKYLVKCLDRYGPGKEKTCLGERHKGVVEASGMQKKACGSMDHSILFWRRAVDLARHCGASGRHRLLFVWF